jgi:hypothetical protein
MKLTNKILKQMITEELDEGLFDFFKKKEKPQLTKDQIMMQKDPTGRLKAVSDYTKMSKQIRGGLVKHIEDARERSDQSRHGTYIGTEKIERKYDCQGMKKLHQYIVDNKHFLFWYFSKDGISVGKKMQFNRPHPVPPRPGNNKQDPEKVGLNVWILEIDSYFDVLKGVDPKYPDRTRASRLCRDDTLPSKKLSEEIPSPQELKAWAQKNISPVVLNPRMDVPKEQNA